MSDEPLITRAQARAVDEALLRSGVPGVLLMENAGRGALDEALGALDRPLRHAVILVGPGNNGGDALVVARHLRARRPDVTLSVLSLRDPAELRGDAAVMRDAFTGVGGIITRAPSDDAALAAHLDEADLVVDGLFGTGLSRALDGDALALVRAVNARRRALVVALDLPTGIDADTGAALGDAEGVLRADLTCTFAASKPGLCTGLGRERVGACRVVSLGAPIPLAELAIGAWRSSFRPPAARSAGSHKGDAGHVVIVGGAEGKIGAALLAARGAHRAGAGLVTVASPSVGAASAALAETMTARLPLDIGELTVCLDETLARARTVVIGPGLGLGAWADAAVELAVSRSAAPLVIDADALRRASAILPATAPRTVVMTPHPLELARALGIDGPRPAERVNADRLGAAREAARRFGAIVLLKGAGTVVATPTGEARVLPYAEPALGVAGSGDVLAGAIGARLAEGVAPLEAVLQAAHAHGRAGARERARRGAVRGVLASEIADALSACLDGTDP